jgi:hypothetical protein
MIYSNQRGGGLYRRTVSNVVKLNETYVMVGAMRTINRCRERDDSRQILSHYMSPQKPSLNYDCVNYSEGGYVGGGVYIGNCRSGTWMMRPWLSILKGILKGILNAYLSFFYFYRHTSQLPSFQKTKLIVEV